MGSNIIFPTILRLLGRGEGNGSFWEENKDFKIKGMRKNIKFYGTLYTPVLLPVKLSQIICLQVNLVDDFFHKKKNLRSHCYRIVYRKFLFSLFLFFHSRNDGKWYDICRVISFETPLKKHFLWVFWLPTLTILSI